MDRISRLTILNALEYKAKVVAHERSDHTAARKSDHRALNFESCEPVVIAMFNAPIRAEYIMLQNVRFIGVVL